MKKSDTVVSICCLAYNHEKYIAQAIEVFLIQQTNFPLEIIIHDDASLDSTASIIKEYCERFPDKIVPIYQTENQYSKGIRPSPTFVWPKARGKYIALCEGDDYWTDPLKLQKQVDLLEVNPNYAGCFHETQQIFEDGRIGKIYGKDTPDILTTEDTFSTLSPLHTSSLVFRNIIGELPDWFSNIVSGDMALFSIISSYGPLKKIPEIMSVYRKHENGITNTAYVTNNFNQKRIELMNYLNEFHNYKYDYKAKEVIEIHQRKLMNELSVKETEFSEFLNPQFNQKNMDLYIVRKSILDTLTNHLPEFKGTLLDLGCGEMPYKQYILSNSKVEKYIGLDIENPTYQKNTKPDLFWDGNQIPLEDNSVDCVLATEFFEHVPYPEKILTEIQRVLKPGGFLLLTVPFIWPLHTMPYDEYRYTPFSLERILRDSDFRDIKIKALGGWNASFAQVMGLWIRRSPMPKDVRNSYTEAFFPFYKSLIESDEIPDNFNSSMLITGLTAVAKKKNNNNDQANDFSDSAINYVECPVCGKTFEKFKPYGANNRPNRCCPECGTVERHRLLWLYLTRKRNILSENLNLLDIAPTKGISGKLKSMPNINYLSIDLTSPLAMRHMDITALDLPDNFYDCVLCYHVFEHIPDDRKAMREVLRVLKPGGWAILQVPINKRLEKTHEGAHILDPAERRRLFGQEDHVRYYGLDYKDRLSEAGFFVYVDEFAKNLPDEEVKKYRLIKDEEIYFCTKPLIDSTNETNR